MPKFSTKQKIYPRAQKSVVWRCAINSQQINFSRFINAYKAEKDSIDTFDSSWRLFEVPGVREFYQEYSGCVFGTGVYRLFLSDEIKKWNDLILCIFSQFDGKIECFSSDWMGRIFAWDFERKKIRLFDPGFGEALIIPCDFVELHNQEFVDFPDESLSHNLYARFIERDKQKLSRTQCAGYKISPFLGGIDQLENIEVTDMEVYWSVCSDIYNQVNSM